MGYLVLIAIGAAAAYFLLYLVIKAAVRDAIIEARHTGGSDEIDRISETACPDCGKTHDIDCPKCPYCQHRY
jgi:hypothetical protein